jgi:hypothetical protein
MEVDEEVEMKKYRKKKKKRVRQLGGSIAYEDFFFCLFCLFRLHIDFT